MTDTTTRLQRQQRPNKQVVNVRDNWSTWLADFKE